MVAHIFLTNPVNVWKSARQERPFGGLTSLGSEYAAADYLTEKVCPCEETPGTPTNPHVTDGWSSSDVDTFDLAGKGLAAVVAAASRMASAVKAILNLDLDLGLGHDGERLVRAEVRHALGA